MGEVRAPKSWWESARGVRPRDWREAFLAHATTSKRPLLELRAHLPARPCRAAHRLATLAKEADHRAVRGQRKPRGVVCCAAPQRQAEGLTRTCLDAIGNGRLPSVAMHLL